MTSIVVSAKDLTLGLRAVAEQGKSVFLIAFSVDGPIAKIDMMIVFEDFLSSSKISFFNNNGWLIGGSEMVALGSTAIDSGLIIL